MLFRSKFGVSRKVADFTGPITMAMNSCGAAQCYVAAIFFMAQSLHINLSAYQMGMAILLSCLMCLGTISVPGGSVIVYIPCKLAGTSAREYRYSHRDRLVRRNVPYTDERRRRRNGWNARRKQAW